MTAQTISLPACAGIYWRLARVIGLYMDLEPSRDTLELCQVLIDSAFEEDEITYQQARMLTCFAKASL